MARKNRAGQQPPLIVNIKHAGNQIFITVIRQREHVDALKI